MCASREIWLRLETAHPVAHPLAYFWVFKLNLLEKYLLCNQGVAEGGLVRDQEVGGSNPLAPTNLFKSLQTLTNQIRAHEWVRHGPYGCTPETGATPIP